MRFGSPVWLAAGLAAAFALIWLWRRYDARQHAALSRFVSAHLRHQLTRSISRGRRRAQRGLFLGAVLCLFAALAQPQAGFHWEQVSRRGIEVIFAVDTSRSMLTPDVRPNRLTRAKLAIDDFVKKLDGDAVGIVAFAGTSFLACPVTLDYGAFHETLNAIDTNTLPRGGTNISSAIQGAQAALRRRPASDKILILMTDGEDLEGSAFEAAEAAARTDALKIYTVGVGTPAGDLIPIAADQGGGFVKDDGGAFVKSRLDETALKAIAGATGGFYVPLGAQAEGLELIFQTVLGSMAKHDLASRRQKVYIERFQWPLAASLAMLLSSLLIGSRRRGRARNKAAPAAAAASVMAMTLAGTHQPAQADSLESKQPVVEYNAGTAAYRAGEFAQAAQSFKKSISHVPTGDPKQLAVQQDAYYNLGNTLYRAGEKTEGTSAQETLQKWNDAVKAYETALQLRADDADSKFNRDLVKRKIEKLKQQQNQNNQDNDKNQNQQQNQQKSDGAQNKGKPPPPGPGQPPQGQPPQGQPPQGQPPQGQPPQGQPPQGQPPRGQPPQGQPTQGQPTQEQPPNAGQSQAAAPPGGDQKAADPQQRTAENQRVPGEMTPEEARQLLDSVKGDEKRLEVPRAQTSAPQPSDKPFKNW